MKLLTPGQTVLHTEEKNIPIQVQEFAGSGTQGEVYAAEMQGQRIAVKWYKPGWLACDPMLRTRLREASRRGPPDPRFLWPTDIVTAAELPGFGYAMPWREDRFREFREVICDRVRPSFRALATAGLQAAESYQRFHLLGFCYVDVSPGNIAFDLDTGEVRISDCDNVDVSGRGCRSAVSGTEGFMAPEIVQNQADPSISTDLWSLAVLLFWAFLRNHPLQGRREYEHQILTNELELRLWGSEALFIFDEGDHSNRPVEGYNIGALLFWPIFPQFLRDLFQKAFTTGIRKPEERIMEREWRGALARLRDAILCCPDCGQENFYDDAMLGQRCWSCGQELPVPRRIVINSSQIVAENGAGVFRHHLDPRRTPDSAPSIARLVRSSRDAHHVEIHNCEAMAWRAILPRGEERRVAPGECIGLQAGVRIVFGDVEAEII
jgi:hypothetical protein